MSSEQVRSGPELLKWLCFSAKHQVQVEGHASNSGGDSHSKSRVFYTRTLDSEGHAKLRSLGVLMALEFDSLVLCMELGNIIPIQPVVIQSILPY